MYDPTLDNLDDMNYAVATPISCIADFRIHKKEENYLWKDLVRNGEPPDGMSMAERAEMAGRFPELSSRDESRFPIGCVPFQFIGLSTHNVN